MFPTVVLIGAGNVGYQMGFALRQAGVPVLQVYSRKKERAREVARLIGAAATDDLVHLRTDAGLYLLAVRDDAIRPVTEKLSGILPSVAFLAHTSGATPAVALQPWFSRFGVFYPLQTISRDRPTDWAGVPMLVDASREADCAVLERLAAAFSRRVMRVDDRQRAGLHVAAVFANNFTNHLLHITHVLMEKVGLPFDLLLPLIRETMANAESGDPGSAQTGPAVRGDQETIARHLELLRDHPVWVDLYALLSQDIAGGQKAGKPSKDKSTEA